MLSIVKLNVLISVIISSLYDNLLNLFVMVNSGKSYKEITDFMETSGIIEAVQNIKTDVDEIKRLKIEFLEKFK